MFWQLNFVEHVLQQTTIFFGIADQHSTEQLIAAGIDNNFLINLINLVAIHVATRTRCVAVSITNTGDINTHQFKLGAHICTGELGLSTGQMGGNHTSHLITRRH